MIKKSTALLGIFALGIVVISALVLRSCYTASLAGMIEEILYAIITGCVFALPSTLVVIVLENHKCECKRKQILNTLERVLSRIVLDVGSDDSLNNRDSILLVDVQTVQDIYYQLLDIQNDYFFKDENQLESLEVSMLSLRDAVLGQDTYNRGRTERLNNIQAIYCKCKSQIEEMLGHSIPSND